jgi:hypothetical protein
MSQHATLSEVKHAALVQLIVAAEWHPGDIVRSTKGITWQFRKTPYTSDFPEANELHASNKARKEAFRSWAP